MISWWLSNKACQGVQDRILMLLKKRSIFMEIKRNYLYCQQSISFEMQSGCISTNFIQCLVLFWVFFFRFPCSTILMWKNVIVAGFGNGQIRLYSAETGKLAAQVNAHARWVTALDVASDNGMVSLPWIVLINPIILWWEKKLTLAGIHKFCITL